MFHTKFVDTYMMYNHTKFDAPSLNGSLVVAVKPKDKQRFCTATMLFYILKN
jgi:hypothetical protein